MSKHEKIECWLTLVECRYSCGERIPRSQLAEHEQDMCEQRPMNVKLESIVTKMEERLMREMKKMKVHFQGIDTEYMHPPVESSVTGIKF